jgi:nucleoside-triphosphatase THEP1
MLKQNIVLLTGARQTGKSTLCRKLVYRLRENGYQVSGLLTRRTGSHDLEVTEIHTASTYPLTLPFDPQAERHLGQFLFSREAVERSNKALDSCFPTQVFILDELGPLEFTYHKGWVKVFRMLPEKQYRTAIIVIRPELLGQAIDAFCATVYTVVNVREENRDTLVDKLYDSAIRFEDNGM